MSTVAQSLIFRHFQPSTADFLGIFSVDAVDNLDKLNWCIIWRVQYHLQTLETDLF